METGLEDEGSEVVAWKYERRGTVNIYLPRCGLYPDFALLRMVSTGKVKYPGA